MSPALVKSYTVKQGTFEGPLGLLLELIQGETLSINEISLAKVTDDFIAHLKTIQEQGETDRELLAEFLVVAATLLLIKSRSLLPQFQANPEETESIAELERRLVEYQRLKELAAGLGALAAGGPKSFSREAFAGEETGFYPPQNFRPDMLAAAFRAFLAALPKVERLAEDKIKRIVSLEEKIRELQTLLRDKVERAFSEVVKSAREKVEVIVSFLALLELAKRQFVSVEQRQPFGDIRIRNVE